MEELFDELGRDGIKGCALRFLIIVAAVVITVILCLLFPSCKAPQPVIKTVEKERIVEIHTRDTAIVTKADSASMQALLHCDSAYNVVVDELTALQGERIKADAHARQSGKQLLLQMDCHEDSLLHEIQLRDSVIRSMQNQVVVEKERYVPAYYKNVSTGFWILLAILVLIIGLKAVKIYFKIQSGGLF